jgi:gas vesicle protein
MTVLPLDVTEQGKFERDSSRLARPLQAGLWPLDCTDFAWQRRLSMLLQDRGVAYFVAGVGFGLAAGCLIGLLYAPQAGRRTRRQIAAALEDGADYVKSKAEDTGDYVQKQTSHLRNEAGDLLDRGKAAIEEGKAGLESAVAAGAKLYRQATR